MSDTSLPVIVRFDTTANRMAFTPTPGISEQLYIWLDSDDQPNSYYWDGSAWQSFAAGSGAGGINQLTGDVTAGPGSGSQVATIANAVVTPAKISDRAAVSVFGRSANTVGVGADIVAGANDRLLTRIADVVAFTQLNAGMVPNAIITPAMQTTAGKTKSIGIVIDGGGSAITTGIKGDISIPFGCTITSVRMLADQSGSIVVDIWKDTYANYPPTVADTITASAKPTISSAIKSEDNTLTGWTTSITSGDTLRFNVDSAATITRLTLQLTVTLT